MPFGLQEELELFRGDNVVDAVNLVKVFQKKEATGRPLQDLLFPVSRPFKAVDGVSIRLKRGETFGLLGPNGSGKTTLIRLLTGLISPTQGRVLVNGKSVEESLERIGVMFGFSMIYHRLTGYNNLKYCAKLYKVKGYEKRIHELARILELGPWLHNYVENYSLGMKCKLALARALLHDPDILFLDEPTLGLDPKISLTIRSLIREMDKTVLLTTHYMDEANELCDRIGIIKKGRIIRVGTPAYLKKLIAENVIVNIGLAYFGNELVNQLHQQEYVHNVSLTKDGVRVHLEHKDFLPQLLSVLASYKTLSVNEEEPTLVDVFIRLTEEEQHGPD